jgi:thiol-disulfide isomerase/thioredoxin
MPKKQCRKSSHLPQALVIAGVAMLAIVILLLKDSSKAETTSVSMNGLPEAHLEQALQVGQPTLAFYHSTNCQQCIVMMDIVGQVYPEYADAITLVDVDVYDERNIPLLQKARIQFIPTLMFFDDQGVGEVHVGVMEVDHLRQTLASLAGGE